MREKIYLILAILILAIFQTSFLNSLFGTDANPNLVLAYIFSILLDQKTDNALFAGVVGGLILDFLSFGLVGVSSLFIVVFIYLGIVIKKYVLKENISYFIVLLIASILYKLISYYASFYLNIAILISSIFTLVACLLQFLIISTLEKETSKF